MQQEGYGFVYTVDASAVKEGNDKETREALLRVIEPIAGEVTIDRYTTVSDSNHRITAYKVWAHR